MLNYFKKISVFFFDEFKYLGTYSRIFHDDIYQFHHKETKKE